MPLYQEPNRLLTLLRVSYTGSKSFPKEDTDILPLENRPDHNPRMRVVHVTEFSNVLQCLITAKGHETEPQIYHVYIKRL